MTRPSAPSTNAAGEPLVLVERRERVAVVTLNRPEARNAVHDELTVAMADVLDELEADDDVWVLVVTGAGDVSFCAGQDLRTVPTGRPPATDEPPRDLGGFAAITTRQFLKPTIAAVNGFALGGGTEICLALDCVVADEHAQFGLPEVTRGLMAAAGGLQRLPRRIPPALAMELILTGRSISAARALEIGLINRVVPSGGCVDAAVELAEEICQASPLAVRYSKAVARTTVALGEDEAIRATRDLRRAVLKSEDFKEGPRAFAEKRPPVWKGR
jgi:enoyl-CoA hydratase/carnithine racemase